MIFHSSATVGIHAASHAALHAHDVAIDELQCSSSVLLLNSTTTLSCRVCGMQELSSSDFLKQFRFTNRGNLLERNPDISADDCMEVALIATLLHGGADARQADGVVSFCP